MKFKKPKQEVLDDILYNTQAQVQMSINNHIYNGNVPLSAGNFTELLKDVVSYSIRYAFQTMLENEYTDEDFEKDLGLKDK